MQSCLHIYTGDGKGKTTAALGLCTRFLGYGGSVLILQFMKGSPSGETRSLEKLGASVCRLSKNYGFYPFGDDTTAITEEHNRLLTKAARFSETPGGLLILDESISAYNLSLLSRPLFLSLLKNANCEIVCTGRDVPDEITALAQYITEMKAVRHPFNNGIAARQGIEY